MAVPRTVLSSFVQHHPAPSFEQTATNMRLLDPVCGWASPTGKDPTFWKTATQQGSSLVNKNRTGFLNTVLPAQTELSSSICVLVFLFLRLSENVLYYTFPLF